VSNKFDETQINEVIRLDGIGFPQTRRPCEESQHILEAIGVPSFLACLRSSEDSVQRGFERITPQIVKEGTIDKEYNWLVLAREASDFPTREYDVPLEGKVPYDFRKIEGFAKILNSEIEREEAVELAKQQIEGHHRFLLQQEVDKIIEIRTDFNIKQIVYLRAPIWFIKYEYKGNFTNL